MEIKSRVIKSENIEANNLKILYFYLRILYVISNVQKFKSGLIASLVRYFNLHKLAKFSVTVRCGVFPFEALNKLRFFILLKMNNETKVCTKCKKEKPATEFHKLRLSKDGLRNRCKECRKADSAEYVKNNYETKIKLYKEANKEKLKEYQSSYNLKYYDKNKEKILLQVSEYTANNIEKIKVYKKEYRKTDIYKASHCNSTSKKRTEGQPSDITAKWLLELRQATEKCELCQTDLLNNNVHLDHIKPIVVGGTHTKDNVRYICKKCNLSRPRDGKDNTTIHIRML